MQRCGRCGLEKPLSNFSTDRSKASGKSGRCKTCKKEAQNKWLKLHPDYVHPVPPREIANEQHQQWREANREKLRAYQNEQSKKRYAEDEARRDYLRLWRQVYWSTLRAKTAGVAGDFTVYEWISLCERYEYRCLSCGREDVKLTVDHVIPFTKGGGNSVGNVQPLCRSCNSSKGTKIIDFRF